MRPLSTLLSFAAVVALGTLTASPALAQGRLGSTIELPRQASGEALRCATEMPTESERRVIGERVRAYRSTARSAAALDQLLIPIAYHIITSTSGAGDVPDQQIAAQHDVLNAAFAPWGIQFDSVLVQRVANNTWHDNFEGNDAQIKAALAVDPATTLNVYFTADLGGNLGYAYLPSSVPEGNTLWGAVNLSSSMPGGGAVPYNLGDTAVHEAGHALGLLHTFDGGCHADSVCDTQGDLVCDTPAEASPYFGACSTSRDTCPTSAGNDPVLNFMDYSDDSCMETFTLGQAELIQASLRAYRPTLYDAALVTDGPGPEGTLSLNTARLGYGSVDLGASKTRTAVVSNPSSESVTIDAISLPEGFSTALVSPVVVGAGGSVNVRVTFTPTVVKRYRSDLVLLTAGGASYSVLLEGKGVGEGPGPGPGPDPVGGISGSLSYEGCPEPPAALAAGNGECRVRLKFTNEGADRQRYTLFFQLDGPNGLSRLAARTEVEPAVGKTIARTPRIRTRASDPSGAYTLTALAELGSVSAPTAEAVTLGSLELVKASGASLLVSEALTVYPNPASGEATLRFAAPNASAVLAVYDALGREVARPVDGPVGGAVEVSVDVSGLPAGLYVARLLVDGRAETVRFSVVR